MLKPHFLLLCLITMQTLCAQPTSLDDPKLTLAERYALMKSTAETYRDFKVVKEVNLDAVYKTMRDSLQASKIVLSNSNKSIAALQAQADSLRISNQQTEASMQVVIYDSTHISVLGINFSKAFFVGMIAIMLGIILVGLVMIIGRMKLMQKALKEKSELSAETALEYTEYKRHAMDKQTKLARELQTELNKPGR